MIYLRESSLSKRLFSQIERDEMSGSKELIALRNIIGELSQKIRGETNDGRVNIQAAIAQLREQYASELATANDKLIDGALAKIFHDVGRRKGMNNRPEDEPGLFALYGLPVMSNVGRLTLKRTAKLTLSEAKRRIALSEKRESNTAEEYSKLKELVAILQPFILDEDDTLEDAARRKEDAENGRLL